MRSRFKKAAELIAAGLAVVVGGTAIAGVGLGVVVLAAVILLSLISLVIATPLWFAWNQIAPSLDFVPAAYQHVGFWQVFFGVAVVRCLRGLVFGRFKVKPFKGKGKTGKLEAA